MEPELAVGVGGEAGDDVPQVVAALEVDLQANPTFLNLANSLGFDPVTGSSIFVKLCYALIFMVVLAVIMWLAYTVSLGLIYGV